MTLPVEGAVATPPASPCVGVCRIEQSTGYCRGCARTSSEISGWSAANEAERQSIWDALPARFEALGVRARRLPWSASETLDFVERSLRDAAGTWVLGVVGAVGEFTRSPDSPLDLRRERRAEGGETLEAVAPKAALRLSLDEATRALLVETPGASTKVILAVKRSEDAAPAPNEITDCGEDQRSIAPDKRGHRLFNLGLGRSTAQFCVRSDRPEILAALMEATGARWPEWLSTLGPAIVSNSPERVIETRLGRVEIDAPIPAPGGASPPGPHTHLLPAHLAQGLDVPADLQIPEVYDVGAIFYPAPEAQGRMRTLLSGVSTQGSGA